MEQFVKDSERFEVLHEDIELTLNATRRGFVGPLKEDLEAAGFNVEISNNTTLHVSRSESY